MNATAGDQLVIMSARLDRPVRDGKILETHGPQGGEPPYLVRWSDTGRVTLVFPGPDARVRHLHGSNAPGKRA